MKKSIVLLLLFTLISCHTAVKKESLPKLNGYWEIKNVVLANGEKKEYKVNETVDFFKFKDSVGFRQKVMPQFDGHFQTNGIKENIKVKERKGEYVIEYSTPYGSWEEQIIELGDSVLVLKNQSKLQYEYKRFTPFYIK